MPPKLHLVLEFKNQKTLQLFIENDDNVSDRTLWLHRHIVLVHRLWNGRMVTAPIDKPWDAYSMPELIVMDTENFKTTMQIIDDVDFDASIQYVTREGELCHNSVRDILFHITNHSTYHRGQIATECRQCGLEPLLTDWIFYKNYHE